MHDEVIAPYKQQLMIFHKNLRSEFFKTINENEEGFGYNYEGKLKLLEKEFVKSKSDLKKTFSMTSRKLRNNKPKRLRVFAQLKKERNYPNINMFKKESTIK